MSKIIKSLLYCDYYKFSMLVFYLENFPDVKARYDLKVRSNFDFSPYLSEIDEHLRDLCSLKFSDDEIQYLKSLKFCSEASIEKLRDFSLDYNNIHTGIYNDTFYCYSDGPLAQASMFEIYVLEILQELKTRKENINYSIGERILRDNLRIVKNYSDINKFQFADFSCRRACSYDWLEYCLSNAAELGPSIFTGTSCVYFAKKLGLKPIGTMAHEVIELGQGLVHPFDSQEFILNKWLEFYNGNFGIALSDTFGAEYFIKKVFNKDLASRFAGVRHDSGNAFVFGDNIIQMYNKLGINPNEKTIVFSDGLTFEKAIGLSEHFKGRINTSYGIGTNFGNAVGIPALQIVMKITDVNGKPVAKISDTSGKGMCRNSLYEMFIKDHIREVIEQ